MNCRTAHKRPSTLRPSHLSTQKGREKIVAYNKKALALLSLSPGNVLSHRQQQQQQLNQMARRHYDMHAGWPGCPGPAQASNDVRPNPLPALAGNERLCSYIINQQHQPASVEHCVSRSTSITTTLPSTAVTSTPSSSSSPRRFTAFQPGQPSRSQC